MISYLENDGKIWITDKLPDEDIHLPNDIILGDPNFKDALIAVFPIDLDHGVIHWKVSLIPMTADVYTCNFRGKFTFVLPPAKGVGEIIVGSKKEAILIANEMIDIFKDTNPTEKMLEYLIELKM